MIFESDIGDRLSRLATRGRNNILVEQTPRRCSTIDQLKRRQSADEADHIAKSHKTGVEGRRYELAFVQAAQVFMRGHRFSS